MKNEVKFKGVPTSKKWAVGPCENEDIAKQVLAIGHNGGVVRRFGDVREMELQAYGVSTCYALEHPSGFAGYASIDFYTSEKFRIIPAAKFIAANQHLLNPDQKQPERFGVGRGRFLVEVSGEHTCLVSIRKRNGEVEWQKTLPIEFATEFAKVETLEKKADTLRKGRDRWEKKTLELRNEVEALTETLSKLNQVHDELNEDHTHQLKRVMELEEKAESLEILLKASKEAQESMRIEQVSLVDGKKYLTERNEELKNQLAQSETKRAMLQSEHDTQMHLVESELFAERQKYRNLLATYEIEKKDSKAYFWISILTILGLVGFVMFRGFVNL